MAPNRESLSASVPGSGAYRGRPGSRRRMDPGTTRRSHEHRSCLAWPPTLPYGRRRAYGPQVAVFLPGWPATRAVVGPSALPGIGKPVNRSGDLAAKMGVLCGRSQYGQAARIGTEKRELYGRQGVYGGARIRASLGGGGP